MKGLAPKGRGAHNNTMPKANEHQVGGSHYKVGEGETEHWDYCWSRRFDFFQYQITKYVERWRKKGGVEDLKKARHFLDKYIELAEEEDKVGHAVPGDDGGPTAGYVDQARDETTFHGRGPSSSPG